ncbi:MAG TPA: RidA family protein [Sphingomicrobium sp.]|nr:RidA family protein [Sphingomicrobium sp.]
MKSLIAIATAVLASTTATAAIAQAARPTMQHFPAGPNAPFSTAVRVGDIVYLSGQIGIAPDGKLPEGFEAQARQTMENVGAALKAVGLGWGDVFKCTVMIDNMADWPKFNTIYVPYFPAGKLPARSAFGADGLALGALLELECMAHAGTK